jgi:hypothetical protein
LSGELANTSDVEVLVNGAAWANATLAPMTRLLRPGKSRFPRRRRERRSGDDPQERQRHHVLVGRKRWYSADRKLFQQGQLALNITRDYYLLRKRQDKPTDPITYDLVPLKGPVHVGDIVAVRLALNGTRGST